MSLKLLIDEDSQAKRLVNLLQSAGQPLLERDATRTGKSKVKSQKFTKPINK